MFPAMRLRALLLIALVLGAAAAGAADAPPFERVSATPSGGEPNDTSWDAAISADGRFVAFASAASNITSRGAAGVRVFLLDRRTHRVPGGPRPAHRRG